MIAFLVAFGAVVVGWALSLDYSAKLFVMTFVLVVMGSEGASGAKLHPQQHDPRGPLSVH
jgi:hypothetical protein